MNAPRTPEQCTCIFEPETDAGQVLHASYCMTSQTTQSDAELYFLLRKAGEPRDDAQALIDRHRSEVLAEVERLTAERDAYCDRVDTLTAVAKGNKRHVQEMFTDLQKAHAEVARLTALVAAMHAAAVGETKTPLLGLVEDVTLTRGAYEAQQHRADQLNRIARERRAEVAELEAERASTNAAVADAAVEREALLKRVAELEAAPSRADVLNEAADALEARVADVDVDTSTTWAGMDAAYLRRMAEAGERS